MYDIQLKNLYTKVIGKSLDISQNFFAEASMGVFTREAVTA